MRPNLDSSSVSKRLTYKIHGHYPDAADRHFISAMGCHRQRYKRLQVVSRVAMIKLLNGEIPRRFLIESYLKGYGAEPVEVFAYRSNYDLDVLKYTFMKLGLNSALSYGGERTGCAVLEGFIVGAYFCWLEAKPVPVEDLKLFHDFKDDIQAFHTHLELTSLPGDGLPLFKSEAEAV